MPTATGSEHRVLSSSPLNSEPSPSTLVSSFVTPTPLIYHRNHGSIPQLDTSTYELTLHYEVSSEAPALPLDPTHRSLPFEKLRKDYDKVHLTGLLMCAGNRREEMDEVKEVEGLKWGKSAVANPTFSGVRLRDVLIEWGVPSEKEPDWKGWHVNFETSQECEDDSYYGSSIPLEACMDESMPVLLAYEMNEQPLTPEHGAPLRVYAPGVIGARSVKWLQRIIIRDEESNCFYQKRDYKILPPQATPSTKEDYMKETDAMLYYAMNTAICSPADGETIKGGSGISIKVEGYAFGSKGIPIKAVHVAALVINSSNEAVQSIREQAQSLPNGHWISAVLQTDQPNAEGERNPSWILWSADVRLQATQGKALALVAWCEDIDGSKQPIDTPWNVRGLGETSWPVVRVSIE